MLLQRCKCCDLWCRPCLHVFGNGLLSPCLSSRRQRVLNLHGFSVNSEFFSWLQSSTFLQTSELEPKLPLSGRLSASATSRILDPDLTRFQLQCCLESNNEHRCYPQLFPVTYLSHKFALPKFGVVEVVGLGLTQAAKEFTLSKLETAWSFCLETVRYDNALCSFLVS